MPNPLAAYRLDGRTALVTGGTRGIGRAVALALGGLGADVSIGYHTRREAADEVVRTLERMGRRAAAVQGDAADPGTPARWVQAVGEALSGPDILVNNAGEAAASLLIDTEPADWDRMIAVHLRAAYAASRAVLPHMLRRGWGRIIHVSSVWGLAGGAGEVAYAAAKSGLVGLTRSLAQEVARSGVTVNAVAPGAIDTDMLGGYTQSELADLRDDIPMGRLGTPDDVAHVAAFLASPAAAYVTGQVVAVSGGWIA